MQIQSAETLFDNAHPVTAETLPVTDIMGQRVVSAKADHVIDTLLDPARKTAFFLNAHCANIRTNDAAYCAALGHAEYVLPDGIGVELAARMTGTRIAENLNGTDFVPRLLAQAAGTASVFLLGGKPGTAEAAAAKLRHMIPGLDIAGTRDGYAGAARSAEVIDEINTSGAQIVLVAMGVPKQEIWIDTHRHLLDARLVLGVGALFDFLAGNVRRAPRAVRRARLEWIWRLAMEPRRMARRYLIGNATFLARAARYATQNADQASVAQRALDVAIAGSALVALGLPMALIAALVRLDSKGPAFFKQTRVGKDGRHFGVYMTLFPFC